MPYKTTEDLPESVSGLPAEAKTVFLRAFNAAYEEHGEEAAFKIAWTAVKNGFEKNDEGTWGRKKTEDSYCVVEQMAFDAATDIGARTQEGYFRAAPRVARTGVQVYRGFELGRDDMNEVRVYRPDSEVFSRNSFRSFAHRPVTIEHPPVLVDAENWKKYAVGYTGEDIVRDGEFVRVPIMLLDSNAIREVESGRSQLSAGYTMGLDWKPGKSPKGESYDAVQKSIRINHVAITKAARGGSQLRIGDAYFEVPQTKGEKTMPMTTIMVGDKRVTVDEDAAPIILKAMKAADEDGSSKEDRIKALEAELARLRGEKKTSEDSLTATNTKVTTLETVIATKDAEIATLKQQLHDSQLTPAKLDTIVKERAEIIDKGKKLIGDKLVHTGKTNTEIMRQVVDARVGAVAKSWDENAVRVSFDTLTVEGNAPDALADALARRRNGPVVGMNSTEVRDAAYNDYCKNLQDAWKTPVATKQ